jgi:hypothetical protein
MRLMVSSVDLKVRRRGPVCIACGNSRQFWIMCGDERLLMEVARLPDHECEIVACGRCGARNSVVVGHVD